MASLLERNDLEFHMTYIYIFYLSKETSITVYFSDLDISTIYTNDEEGSKGDNITEAGL